MYKIQPSNKFLKDAKLLKKRSPKDLKILEEIIDTLANYGHKGLKPNIEHTNYLEITAIIGNAM